MNIFKKIWDSLKSDYENGAWIMLTLKLAVIIIVLICGGTVLYIVTYKILQHLEEIVITIGAAFCFFVILFSFLPKKQPAPAPVETTIMEYDPITLENTYRMLRKIYARFLGSSRHR